MATDEIASREVKYQYSRNLPEILGKAGLSIAVSTYETGKLVLLSAERDQLYVELNDFERAVGVAFQPECLAVASRDQIWFLPNSRAIATQLDARKNYDACFLTRRSHVTGNIQVHELHWSGDDLWLVNTLFSSLCTVSGDFSFIPRWRPPFVTALAAEDRCHLNGFAFEGRFPKYVTALAETDTAYGWRSNAAASGCVIDVASGKTVLRALSMPHSPRLHGGKLWLLESGTGRLLYVDPVGGRRTTIAELPGFTRGLAFYGTLAFVGFSKIRESSESSALPIAQRRDKLRCGIAVVDLLSGELLGTFEFQSTVDEVFDVVVLPEVNRPTVRGPRATEENKPIPWLVPQGPHQPQSR